jgi:tRNA A37 N6-isopentenylltransferase MiaA
LEKNYLITIIGPTAIGKTSLSIALAQHFNCDIISCDSRQFFKEMKIGTAVPSEKELAKHGFKVVIYANHLLRASYKAMHEAAKKILINRRAFEIERNITSVNEIISLIKS